MKYALISPVEPREAGYRVAEVADNSFEIAPPLFWVECADDVVADVYWYDPSDETIKPVPVPVVEPTKPVVNDLLSTPEGTE